MPLPLQTTASIFFDKQFSALSLLGCLPLWPLAPWLHSCGPITSWGPWDFARLRTSPGCKFSRSTFILMQLPAFLRVLTASWWVAPCMLTPLTWIDHGHITVLRSSWHRSRRYCKMACALFPSSNIYNKYDSNQFKYPKCLICTGSSVLYWFYQWIKAQMWLCWSYNALHWSQEEH